MGKSRHEELDADGHTAVRREGWIHASVQLLFSLFSPSRGSSGIHKGAWQWGRRNLPTSVNMIKIIPHRHSQKPFSQVTLDCVKLTVVSSFHIEIIDTKPGSG